VTVKDNEAAEQVKALVATMQGVLKVEIIEAKVSRGGALQCSSSSAAAAGVARAIASLKREERAMR